MYHLHQFLRGRQRDMPQETIQVLDVVLRESPSWNYVTVSRSFFSTTFGHRGDIGEGLECWRGYYQSLRPTQMGLSLNIDISATSFFKPVTVIKFVEEFLNIRDTSRPLSDRDRVKIKKALRGVRIETSHQPDQIRRYKITGITPIPMSQLIFPIDEKGTRQTVVQYFWDKYNYRLKYGSWPCLQAGSDSRPVYLPMEVCKIVEGQRYSKKLNDKQVTNILRATCKRPQEREQSIRDMVLHNKYAEDMFAQEFGIEVSNDLVSVPARVLPPPMLKYHGSRREKVCAPSVGQWNMINKRKYDGIFFVLLLLLTSLSLIPCVKAQTFDTKYCDALGAEISAFCPLLTQNGDCCPIIIGVMDMGQQLCLCHLLKSEVLKDIGFTPKRSVDLYYKCKGRLTSYRYTNITDMCEGNHNYRSPSPSPVVRTPSTGSTGKTRQSGRPWTTTSIVGIVLLSCFVIGSVTWLIWKCCKKVKEDLADIESGIREAATAAYRSRAAATAAYRSRAAATAADRSREAATAADRSREAAVEERPGQASSDRGGANSLKSSHQGECSSGAFSLPQEEQPDSLLRSPVEERPEQTSSDRGGANSLKSSHQGSCSSGAFPLPEEEQSDWLLRSPYQGDNSGGAALPQQDDWLLRSDISRQQQYNAQFMSQLAREALSLPISKRNRAIAFDAPCGDSYAHTVRRLAFSDAASTSTAARQKDLQLAVYDPTFAACQMVAVLPSHMELDSNINAVPKSKTRRRSKPVGGRRCTRSNKPDGYQHQQLP